MSSSNPPYPDATEAQRATLRAAVAEVESYIAHLPRTNPGSDHGLPAAWATLVQLMALGSPPQLRDCPRCGRAGMRAATRCGHCWARLSPLGLAADDRQVAGGVDDS